MRTAIAMVMGLIISTTTGCYESQHDSINYAYIKTNNALDINCKADITEWCKEQYRRNDDRVERKQSEDKQLEAASNRTAIIAVVIVVSTMAVVGTAVGLHCMGGGCK